MPNQNQIANPHTGQLPQVKGPQMNDRDFLNDGLATCKYLTDSLNVAVREASHQQLYADMLQILTQTHQSAREMYDLMFRKGWYKLEAEEQQKLQQAHQQFSGYSTQFPYH
ncbi:spore coat protein [Brevibacillus ruminantium]|uniref:Spore coat protein n=1 Tax=Brevibacillus ruminantium TaxID=2950604 RepID=A0ABY4WJ29_9BACL|nr:spore coat protein [Brevibacillus ruminantium]USG66704.1 spore coat protein [Brevibacillus ruminantium]